MFPVALLLLVLSISCNAEESAGYTVPPEGQQLQPASPSTEYPAPNPNGPFNCSNDPNCPASTCHSNGCDQCADGYYKLNYSTPCYSCSATFPNCSFCQDFQGCGQCENGFSEVETSMGRACAQVGCELDSNCAVCQSNAQVCSQCVAQFFLANENLPCIACPIINGCQACQDFKGCSQCSNASDLTQNTYLYGEIPYQLYDCNQGLDYSAMSTMVKPSNMAAVVSYTLPTFILAILALVLS